MIRPRIAEIYRWSAHELQLPGLLGLIDGEVPAYAWSPADTEPWTTPASLPVRIVRRVVP